MKYSDNLVNYHIKMLCLYLDTCLIVNKLCCMLNIQIEIALQSECTELSSQAY